MKKSERHRPDVGHAILIPPHFSQLLLSQIRPLRARGCLTPSILAHTQQHQRKMASTHSYVLTPLSFRYFFSSSKTDDEARSTSRPGREYHRRPIFSYSELSSRGEKRGSRPRLETCEPNQHLTSRSVFPIPDPATWNIADDTPPIRSRPDTSSEFT
jgi:hypothetical protein